MTVYTKRLFIDVYSSLQTVQEARLVRAFLCLGIYPCLPLYLPSVYPLMYLEK